MSKSRHGPHQTRVWPPPAYEIKLARTLEEVYGRGVYDLSGVVNALNQTTVVSPDGGRWTEESFKAAMRKLGE